ncbi:MAG: D-lyxose/D-mannose family sugar isomerase [Victivallales bacterium]
MQRSQINRLIRDAEIFFAGHKFKLPPFASWTPEDWQNRPVDTVDEIIQCGLGWDITDFGLGDFYNKGLLLFTVRNGVLNNRLYPKSYAEKIMISRAGQVTLMHCHINKTEDIINRGGGNLIFELYNREGGKKLAGTAVTLQQDGVKVTLPAGGRICLTPGESITLEPGVFHQFWAEKDSGDVMIGEVSSVNDDHHDNVYYHEQLRFPEITEDEPPYRLLSCDYRKQICSFG